MTPVDWVLTLLVIALLIVLYVIVIRQMDTDDAMFNLAKEREQDHAKCMAMVAAFVGDTFAAQVLTAASVDYDSPEGQVELRMLAQNSWVEGGTSMPALWLRERAKSILVKSALPSPNADADPTSPHTYWGNSSGQTCWVGQHTDHGICGEALDYELHAS